MQGWSGEGLFKLKQDEWRAAGGELMELMDSKCMVGVGKEHRSYNKMADALLEVSIWR